MERNVRKGTYILVRCIPRLQLTQRTSLKMCNEQRKNVLILFCALVVSIQTSKASKCPEARKPHVTSCTIFYDCINLPEGGYVWAPATCPNGLVFQPYLRICILPGDAWTCVDSAGEKDVLSDNRENPQLTYPSRTSYPEYRKDFPTLTEHSVIEDTENLGNLRPLATPYPLIEIITKKDEKYTPPKDSMSQTTEERTTENYLYEFFASQHRLKTRLNKVASAHDGKNKYTWLHGIVDRILFFEDNEATRTSCQQNRQNVLEGNVLDYLVQSYVLGTRNPMQEGSRKKEGRSTTRRTLTGRIDSSEDQISTTPTNFHQQSAIDELIKKQEYENNVVVVEGNLGEKEYVTIEKYKSLSGQIKLRVLDILACAKGVRLPNITDCTKYYTCDPETANIAQFTCPAKTAFNDYNHVCDFQRYKACRRRHAERFDTTTQHSFTTVTALSLDDIDITVKNEPCRSTGKFADPMSKKHYYVCYSPQTNQSAIESVRMTCPNDLIFCQERRVCSTQKRCYDQ